MCASFFRRTVLVRWKYSFSLLLFSGSDFFYQRGVEYPPGGTLVEGALGGVWSPAVEEAELDEQEGGVTSPLTPESADMGPTALTAKAPMSSPVNGFTVNKKEEGLREKFDCKGLVLKVQPKNSQPQPSNSHSNNLRCSSHTKIIEAYFVDSPSLYEPYEDDTHPCYL